MRLKILLPFKIYTQKEDIMRIVVKTTHGFLGLLPHRLDCVAVITPGILTWESESEGQAVIAIDEGLLVKTGTKVFISVRNAIGGTDIEKLHEAVQQNFIKQSQKERNMRVVLSKLESGFISRFAELQHG